MVHNYNLQRPHLFDFSAIREATTGQIKAAAWVMEVGLLERIMLPQAGATQHHREFLVHEDEAHASAIPTSHVRTVHALMGHT
ncbi:hypothetical protein PHMEG_00014428 [Phytophthora megakarya]|uniref:Uncharacterized protein n=1 Tax=Phytophthora megakarya TaxID=4795 RepID=A0A225W401_9STRA|nr:hypothetical protein PHMEG_00014428 [Phytophthora megakarya]